MTRRDRMLHFILSLIVIFGGLFWFAQVIDLLFRHPSYFENHTHKLIWFLVVWIGFIIGAAWYYVWKRDAIKKVENGNPFEKRCANAS